MSIIQNFYKKYKAILRLAIPGMLENILQVLLGVVDIYFVGKIGTKAIAGVGVTNLTMNVYIAIFLALAIASGALISRFTGQNSKKDVSNALNSSLSMGIVISLLFGFLNLIYAKEILSILGANEDIYAYAYPYFIAVAVPCVLLCLQMILSAALRAGGDGKTPLKVVAISNVINIVLDYILIFGIFNFNGFGILGAGLATSIARLIGVILLIKNIQQGHPEVNLSLFRIIKPQKTMIKRMAKLSIPAAIEKLIMRSGQMIYGGMIIRIGTEAYAAHNIAGTIESFSYLPGMGFSVAAATLVGQNLGRDDKKTAKKMAADSYFLSVILMMTLGAIFFIAAPFLASIFTEDPLVKDMVVKVLRIIALFQPFLALTLVMTAALQGAGDTKFPMYTSLIGIWGVRVLGVYILSIHFNFGLVGVWLAYALDITIRGIIILIRFLRGKWLDIEIT